MDREWAAKEALQRAIIEYHSVVNPDAFITGWVLVSAKESTEMHANGVSALSVLPATDQPFYNTTGMLLHATDQSRAVVHDG